MTSENANHLFHSNHSYYSGSLHNDPSFHLIQPLIAAWQRRHGQDAEQILKPEEVTKLVSLLSHWTRTDTDPSKPVTDQRRLRRDYEAIGLLGQDGRINAKRGAQIAEWIVAHEEEPPSVERLREACREFETETLEEIGRALHKTGRNDPCPCGSGKKFKKCCGGN